MNNSRSYDDDKIYYETERFLGFLITEAPSSPDVLKSRMKEVFSHLTDEERQELILLSYYISSAIADRLKTLELTMCLSPTPFIMMATYAYEHVWASEDLRTCLGYEPFMSDRMQRRIRSATHLCSMLRKSDRRHFGRIVNEAIKYKPVYDAPA